MKDKYLRWIFQGSIIASGTWLALAGGMARNLRTSSPDMNNLPADAAVLTGGSGRVDTATALLKHDKIARLYVSGVSSSPKTIFNKFGIDAKLQDKITFGAARNTNENAAEIAKWISDNDIKRILIITSSYHAARTLEKLKEALKGKNVDIVMMPIGDHLDLSQFYKPRNFATMVKEEAKRAIDAPVQAGQPAGPARAEPSR